LESFLEVTPNQPNRQVLVQQPGVKVVHLTLAAGQVLPPHKHPGCYVLLQGLSGTTTVQLEEGATLPPQHLLCFFGERLVSLRNDSDGPSALLVTLVERPDKRSDDEYPSPTRDPSVS
jgi:hypothetical protein